MEGAALSSVNVRWHVRMGDSRLVCEVAYDPDQSDGAQWGWSVETADGSCIFDQGSEPRWGLAVLAVQEFLRAAGAALLRAAEFTPPFDQEG